MCILNCHLFEKKYIYILICDLLSILHAFSYYDAYYLIILLF